MIAEIDRLFVKLLAKPGGNNSLFALESERHGISWRGVPEHLHVDSQFMIASCTKLFTTALVLQLVETGGLDLDRPAQDFLPSGMMAGLHVLGGVDHGRSITLRHLLSNTSGLPDYFEGKPKGAPSFMQRVMRGEDFAWSEADALKRVRIALKPVFPPGTPGKALYSDTNWQLLGRVLEEARGMSFARLVADKIVAPLGLAHTYVFSTESISGYRQIAPLSAGRRSLHVPNVIASVGAQGGVISTLGDSLTFLRAFFGGRLFKVSWIEQMAEFRRIFFPFRYGMGLMQMSMHPMLTGFRRLPTLVGHSGSSGVVMYTAPEEDLWIVGSTNQLKSRGMPYQFVLRAMSRILASRSRRLVLAK